MTNKLKVLLVASEVAPYAKTGGLADVTGALPGALRNLGHDVRVMLPKYRMVDESGIEAHSIAEPIEIPIDGQVFEGRLHGFGQQGSEQVILVENKHFYDREFLYGDAYGDFGDNDRRFVFFCRTVLEACKRIGFQPDVIHCHDWQTGLIPVYLKTIYSQDTFFQNTATVFTIHNVGYQGVFPPETVRVAGLPHERVFHIDGKEYYGNVSFLKTGIVYSEVVNTVSARYAKEIQSPEYGFGMDGILSARHDAMFGILNGVDYKTWDPRYDTHLPAKFGPEDMSGKAVCKKALLKQLKLPAELAEKPVMGVVTRLSGQKGMDILAEVVPRIAKKQVGLVLLGEGEEHLSDAFRGFALKYPKKIGVKIGFDETLAHRIIAGSDFLIIPSRYEPCGLTQMYAMRCGTVPVVRTTGGLDDTVAQWDAKTRNGNGFRFDDFTPDALVSAIEMALKAYRSSGQMETMRNNGMAEDFSWNTSAKHYEEVYQIAYARLP